MNRTLQQLCLSDAPQMRTIEEQDPHRHADNLTNWTQQYDQLSDGCFYGRIDKSEQPHTHFFREYTSQSLRQQCNVWPDAVWFGFAADGKACRINGQLTRSNTIMSRPGRCDFELVTPEDFTIYGIVVTHSILQQLGLDGAQSDAAWQSLSSFDIPASSLVQLGELQRKLLSAEAEGMDPKIKHDFILNALSAAVQERQPVAEPIPSFDHRKRVVDRIKQHLAAHGDAPVTMTELCELTYVSRRTLQYSFETILGISPLKFLRATRLNQVRRALLQHSGERTISEVACHWGFWHAGQFAKDYKQLFGETPSATVSHASLISGCKTASSARP